ncbi:SDR family oxidoreductase [Leeia sp. TBRC 13508]|uniref:SDR family oxidoreductase n=1 Tax=Leeia speluncae TaxID=2884804 RepID=A0ABS8D209_9NEIS|nr:SDR family oxidoreductase [Leeia speluncae]MCB6182229.1 SDR family oxidoreductase [Leeia speluncae]
MRVLVTGGAGFIGSHLTELLVANGHHVTVIDDLSCGKRENILHLLSTGLVDFHHLDIRQKEAIFPLFQEVDWVFHLAGKADIVPSIEQPEDYYSVNVTGTFNVLQAARAAGVKRFVYAASSSCYGLATKFPTPETAPIQPQYPYALTKEMGEELVLHWSKVYQLPCVSLRLFNVYGPRARTSGAYGAVFGVFLAQLSQGLPLTVVGDGSQTRDFTFVADVANAFFTAAKSDISGEIMNVGSGGHYSVNYLVQLLGAEYCYIPKRPGEPDCTFADTTKISQLLGWKPKVSFEQGVEIMKTCAKDWQDAPLWTPDSISQATASWFKYLGD